MYLKNEGKAVKVITHDRDLKKFCEYANIEYIYFDSFVPNFFGEFYKIPKRKQILDDLIKKIDFSINDNFYFYVNDKLLTYGGTSGKQDVKVIRRCQGCEESDGWCIPPIELTASSEFKFGEWNDIYVLVEDYCVSGGLKAFGFYMA